MAKTKIKKTIEKKNYFGVAIGIFVSVLSILMIGRVQVFQNFYLILSIIFGDYCIFVLLFTIFYCVKSLIMNKKVDLHHISFLGLVLIYFGISMLAHLGLYSALSMSRTTVLTKTCSLYGRYFKVYEHSFSCGGGILVALFLQIIMFLGGKIASILIAISMIVVGINYVMDLKLFRIFRKGKFKFVPLKIGKSIYKYFKEIHTSPIKSKSVKIPISILMDNEENVNFTLQQEINREVFQKLKEYITKNHIYCVCDRFETSYTSSRIVLKLAHKSENVLTEISAYFNRCCFFIKNDLTIHVELANQFKKLLTLKSLLLAHKNRTGVVLGIDVDNQGIELDLSSGKNICIFGDPSSGVKTFIRSYISSLFFKGYSVNDIYFYDLYQEFTILSKTKIHYINNERSTSIAFDEAFSEYERRSELLKYLNVETVLDANKKIVEMGSEYEQMNPIFHILFLNPHCFDTSMYQKLSYVMQFGSKVGMIVMIVIRDRNSVHKIDTGNCDVLSFHISDLSTSVKLFGCDIGCRLQKKGDVLYQSKNKIYHGQTPYISLDDFEKIIDHL